MSVNVRTQSATGSSVGTRVVLPAVLALFIGATMVLTTGFASPSVLHNAAHDTRHAMAFPCH